MLNAHIALIFFLYSFFNCHYHYTTARKPGSVFDFVSKPFPLEEIRCTKSEKGIPNSETTFKPFQSDHTINYNSKNKAEPKQMHLQNR